MTKLRVLDLFSGIGGFSLGLERTGGFETAAFCEIDPFCRRVLAKHWPSVPCFDDVTTLRGESVGTVDVICGGFPCQDISLAGNVWGLAEGLDGARSGLWSEFSRLIGELGPIIVVVENVAALLGRWLGVILGDLAALGYDAEWHCIPASAVGAPHRRDRIWIVAYAKRFGLQGQRLPVIRQQSIGSEFPRRPATGGSVKALPDRGPWEVEPDVGRVADGVPARMDRLRSLGNAVVPQIPELIGNAILESMRAAST